MDPTVTQEIVQRTRLNLARFGSTSAQVCENLSIVVVRSALLGWFSPWFQGVEGQTEISGGYFYAQKLSGVCTYKRGMGHLWSTCGQMELGPTFFTIPTIYAAPRDARGPKRGDGGRVVRGTRGGEGTSYPGAALER